MVLLEMLVVFFPVQYYIPVSFLYQFDICNLYCMFIKVVSFSIKLLYISYLDLYLL